MHFGCSYQLCIFAVQFLLHALASANSCEEVKKLWQHQFNVTESISTTRFSNLITDAKSLCFPSADSINSCCSSAAIYQLYVASELEFNYSWSSWLSYVFETTLTDSKHLRSLFVSSLNTTVAVLHSNFKQSYGYNYELNQDFFFRFFDGLKMYMLGQKQNLSRMIDLFFRELLFRVVRLMLFAKSESELRTADCVAKELEKHNPFDQTPEIIKALMARAFPPARIAANALLLGNELLAILKNHSALRKECIKHWMKLRYCNLCSAVIPPFICPHSCRLAFSNCLRSMQPVMIKWTEFIDRLLPVLGALQGPTSFPQVNRPVQIHITDAIMNLQRSFSHIDQVLLANCTRHVTKLSTRNRRSAMFRNPASQAAPHMDLLQPQYELGTLEEWSKKAVKKYSTFRTLFMDLPIRFCTDDFLRTSRWDSTNVCWDGERLIDSSVFGLPKETDHTPSSLPVQQETTIDSLSRRLQRMNEMLDAITRYHADPNYLPVNNSNLAKYFQPDLLRNGVTPKHENPAFQMPSTTIPKAWGTGFGPEHAFNTPAPLEFSSHSNTMSDHRQNAIQSYEDGSGLPPSFQQTNPSILERNTEREVYPLFPDSRANSMVRENFGAPTENTHQLLHPAMSYWDDEDSVTELNNKAIRSNQASRDSASFQGTTYRLNRFDSSQQSNSQPSIIGSGIPVHRIPPQYPDPPSQIWIPATRVQTLTAHNAGPHFYWLFSTNFVHIFSILFIVL